MAIDPEVWCPEVWGCWYWDCFQKKNMYGYEMMIRWRSVQKMYWAESGNTVSTASRSGRKQFLNSYEQEVLGKVRKYYQITPEGRKHLEQKKEEWKEYSKASAMFWRWRCKHENGWIPQNSDRTGALQQDAWFHCRRIKRPYSWSGRSLWRRRTDHEQALELAVREMGDPVETGVALDRIHRPHMPVEMLVLVSLISVLSLVFYGFMLVFAEDASINGMEYWCQQQVKYTMTGFCWCFWSAGLITAFL